MVRSFSALSFAVLHDARHGHFDSACSLILKYARAHHINDDRLGADDVDTPMFGDPSAYCDIFVPKLAASIPKHGRYALDVKPSGRFVIQAWYADDFAPTCWDPTSKDVKFLLSNLKFQLGCRRRYIKSMLHEW